MDTQTAEGNSLPKQAPDPWFNPHLFPASKRAHAVVVPVVRAVESYRRTRKLKSRDRQTLHRVLVPLVANLIHHHLTGSPGKGFPVPRSHRDKVLGGKGNRYQPLSFPRSFPKTLDALVDLGFVKQAKGDALKRKRTTIKAGPKLITLVREHQVSLEDLSNSGHHEVIILKGPKRGRVRGDRQDYRDTQTTQRFREELHAINDWLARADIAFDLATYPHPVDVQARQLRRHFTNAFDKGGRLFGGFWENLKRDVRLRGIRIDGEAVVGLDYSQVNPLLAYFVAGAEPPRGDAYTLPGLKAKRDGVKKVFNAMLFKHPLEKLPKGSRKLFPRRIRCKDVTEAIFSHHPKLKGVLSSTEIGHHLQFLESKIMMGVLLKCLKRDIIALPVFDSVIVKSSVERTVEKIMRQEFKAVTGLNVLVKRELPGAGTSQELAAEAAKL